MRGVKKRVGVIGAGTIGKAVISHLQETDLAEIDYVLVRDARKLRDVRLADGVILDNAEAALSRRVDLVIEAAIPDTVKTMAPLILRNSDFCAFSCTALADAEIEAAVRTAMSHSGRSLFIPHGAVLGLDGIADGRSLIGDITITTTKSGTSLGLDADVDGMVFDGPTRDACRRFPRNVNVHAAIAMAGIGFDRTRSRIVAVPGFKRNMHRIEVKGECFAWTIEASSPSLGGVTGAYTPLSAVGSVRRILNCDALVLV